MHNHFQRWLFNEIEKSYPKRSEMVRDLCKVLSISKDPVYWRLRIQSELTSEEVILLARHYHLSLDNYILDASNRVVFDFSPVDKVDFTFIEYYRRIHDDLLSLKKLDNHHLMYTSPELPLFYLAYFPELFLFKLYTWGRISRNNDYLKNQKFSLDLFPYSSYLKPYKN